MKKKILGGLLASVIVCLAFVFTNASDPMYSVSGTVTVYDENNEVMDVPVRMDITRGTQTKTSEIFPGESFDIQVTCSDLVTFSYSDESGSASSSKHYCENRTNEEVSLHYSISSTSW